jgi:hypothetical protein
MWREGEGKSRRPAKRRHSPEFWAQGVMWDDT